MDTYMVIFRLIHILAGTFWVGAGVFMVLFVLPTVRSLGPGGQPFMQNFFRITRFNNVMPVASLLTTLAGVALYDRVSDHFNADWMSATPGVVLSIGAVLGIAGFLHGAGVTGPSSSKIARFLKEFEGQAPPPELLGELHALQAKMALHGKVSVILTTLALVFMAAARYM